MTERQLRVLLVEDEASLREPLAKYLRQKYAYDVVAAMTGAQAWLFVNQAQGQFDVALIDNLLAPDQDLEPEPRGIHLMTEIKARYPDIAFILFTGWGIEESGISALRAGAYRYLAKPFSPDELAILIQMAAEQAQLRRERDLLSATLEISKSITSDLSTEKTLDTIINMVPRLVGAEVCTVVLPNAQTKRFNWFHSKPLGNTQIVWRRHLKDRPLTRLIIETGDVFELPDIDVSPEQIDEDLRRAGVKSFIGVPISGRSTNLGALYAYSIKPWAFSNHERQVLSLLAEQAAIALENARLYEQVSQERDRSEQMASQLRALHEIAREMQSELDLLKLLNTIARLAAQLLNANAGGILLLDEVRTHLSFKGAYGLGEKIVLGTRDVVGGSIAGRVVQTGKPIIANNIPNDSRFYNPAADGEGLLAIISIPLQIQGEIIGTLDVHSKSNLYAFDNDDLQVLSLMANQAAVAIANAQYFAKMQAGSKTLQSLYEGSNAIISTMEQQDVLKAVVETARRALGGWRVNIVLIDASGQATELAEVGFENGLKYTHIIRPTGISMQVVQSGQPWYSDDIQSRSHGVHPILLEDGVCAAACVPLSLGGKNIGVMWVHYRAPRQFLPIEIDALRLYANQAAIAYANANLVAQLAQQKEHLDLLLEASNIVAQAENLTDAMNRLAEMLVTSLDVTYCRILLLNERQDMLQISAVYPQGTDHVLEWTPDLKGYVPVAQWKGLKTYLEAKSPKLLQRTGNRRHKLLDDLRKQLNLERDIQSLLLIPIRTSEHILGLLGLGELRALHEAPITNTKQDLAVAIAAQTATLIARLQLQERAQADREQLRSFYAASNTLISSHNPTQVLKDIVEQARLAANATWVSLILVKEVGRAHNLVTVGTAAWVDIEGVIRPNGLSMEVIRTGQPIVIENTYHQRERLNPIMFENGVAAAICLPVTLHRQRVGVVWVHYDKPRQIGVSEIDALHLYVNQAAIAYDTSQRMDELEHMRQAAQSLAGAADLAAVLAQIVKSARAVLQADSAFIWSYDPVRDTFIMEQSIADGIHAEQWVEFRKVGPSQEGTTATVMQRHWIGISDIEDRDASGFVGDKTLSLLRKIGVRSFQGIALRVGDENLGALYVNYGQRRVFDRQERERAQSFADHAALALKNARLLDQVSHARDVAKIFAQVTTLADLEHTLQLVTNETREVLKGDVVTLFVYEQGRQDFKYPPTFSGNLFFPDRALRLPQVERKSIVFEILKRDKIYIAKNTATDRLFKKARFAHDEAIKTCVAIPLQVASEKVGVMFVNYRSKHNFTKDEFINVELFANQTAVAIKNAQLYDEITQRLTESSALRQVAVALAGTSELYAVLDLVIEEAIRLTDTQWGNVLLWDAEAQCFTLTLRKYANGRLEQYSSQVRTQGGFTRRIIDERRPIFIMDTLQEADANPSLFAQGCRAILGVPLINQNNVIGVLFVRCHEPKKFSNHQIGLLETLASQASVAVSRARQHEALQRQNQHQKAVYAASKAISAGITTTQQWLLERILEQAVTQIKPARALSATFGIFQLYNSATNELCIVSIYPLPADIKLQQKLGHKHVLERAQNQIGISGRTVLQRKPQRVADVHKDSDYVDTCQTTHSQLSVPLVDGNQILGVLTLESDQLDAFDDTDQQALESLAELVVIAIQNSRQYQELEQTKVLVASRTSLAWMGMVSAVWRHSIGNHATTIADTVQHINRDLDHSASIQELQRRLDGIVELARQIRETPITAPLSIEEGIDSVFINDLIRERMKQLWQREPYKLVLYELKLAHSESCTVRVSSEWLKRAFDIFIDNALYAMEGMRTKQIEIATNVRGHFVEVSICDTGRGIPDDLYSKLFREPIKKPKGSKGAGMGLLIAATIVQTYGGDVFINSAPAPFTTSIIVRLPLEISQIG